METLEIIVKLLTIPLETLKMTIFDLECYPLLLSYLEVE